ncbi:MAG TPA: MFS transporter [Pirellulales bacterium]|jgi:MFS family permease|nr:MFS transporter [Pirellulales bacterium]
MNSSPDISVAPASFTRAGGVAGSPEPLVYGRAFWCAYISNTALMMAISLLYRYADFVLYLGGDEWTVGLIVGVGMVGSLVMRFFQGFGIDHFGPRRIWLASMAGFVAALLGHLWLVSATSPAIFLLRVLYSTSVAGAFGASITSVSRSLPLARMAEVIGTLGTSGFIAMALGPQLGDILCGHENITRRDLDMMFYVAAALGALSLVCAELATRGQTTPRRRRRPHLTWLLRRYHPGRVLVVGIVMGVGFVLPTTFLPIYTKQLDLPRTGPFFVVYAITAFLARIGTRRLPHVLGVRPMIFLGLASLLMSLLCYLPVETEWGLALPAVFAGISHAVLFPSVTAQGSFAFPNRYRGLGTTVMLAMLDVGTLFGAPLIGGLLDYSKHVGLPPYPVTFLVLGILVAAAGTYYACGNRR